MPTATGKPTADEKREAERLASREARQTVSAAIEPREWYEAQADAFVALLMEHRKGQLNGTIPSYQSVEVWYPVGEEHKVKAGRRTIEIDEGKARAYGVSDVLHERGIDNHNKMQFGIFAGRATIQYAVVAH